MRGNAMRWGVLLLMGVGISAFAVGGPEPGRAPGPYGESGMMRTETSCSKKR